MSFTILITYSTVLHIVRDVAPKAVFLPRLHADDHSMDRFFATLGPEFCKALTVDQSVPVPTNSFKPRCQRLLETSQAANLRTCVAHVVAMPSQTYLALWQGHAVLGFRK